MAEKELNRIKVVLVERKHTAKWLAESLGKDPTTVSKWCTNKAQPSLEMLMKVAETLQVDIKELLVSNMPANVEKVIIVQQANNQ